MSPGHLRLLPGGKCAGRKIGGIMVRLAPARSRRQLRADVMVFEEDTNLIMTVDEIIDYQEIHPVRLFTQSMNARRHPPGRVVVNGRSWYAVVIDIDAEPACQTEWIVSAYAELLRLIERHGVQTVALTLLGNINGGIPVDRALKICLDSFARSPGSRLRELTIVIADGDLETARRLLAAVSV